MSGGRRHAEVGASLPRPQLQVIARRGVGYDKLDLAAIRAAGKVATVAVGGNDACVADRVLAAVPHPDPAYGRANGIRYARLEELLEQCDYVTLHAPLTPATRHLIDAAAHAAGGVPGQHRARRPGRRPRAAGRAGRRAPGRRRAGRVRERGRSRLRGPDVKRTLLAMPNVVGTPHSATSTREGLARTNMLAAQCVIAVLDGGAPPPDCVIADGRPSATQQQ